MHLFSIFTSQNVMKKYHYEMWKKQDEWHAEPKNVMFVKKKSDLKRLNHQNKWGVCFILLSPLNMVLRNYFTFF
jgi:hypothetical protein